MIILHSKKELTQAVLSKCRQCPGGVTDDKIMNCDNIACGLHSVRPFQLLSRLRVGLYFFIVVLFFLFCALIYFWRY